MEFENLLMKIILKYCRENHVTGMTCDDAWNIAKRIATITKPKNHKKPSSLGSRVY